MQNATGKKYYYVEGLGCQRNNDEIGSPTQSKYRFFDYIIAQEDFTYVCHQKFDAPLRGIVNSAVGFRPMKQSKFLHELVQNVINHAKENEVYIYGHSFGGAIVNRLAEELSTINHQALLQRIFIGAFGSIYLAKLKTDTNVNLINYIAIGDVANTTTWGIKHKSFINDDELKTYKEITQEYTNIDDTTDIKTICKYKPRENTNIIDVCLFNFTPNDPLCTNKILAAPIIRAKYEWEIHNGYIRLIQYLMMHRTNNITSLDPLQIDKLPSAKNFKYDDDTASISSDNSNEINRI